jgi:hypothetical protein
MFIVVQHRVSDPAKFWEIAKTSMPNLPEDLKDKLPDIKELEARLEEVKEEGE